MAGLAGFALLLGACKGPAAPRSEEDLSAVPELGLPPPDFSVRQDLAPPPADLVVLADLSIPADLGGYPAGPYGPEVGQALSPLVWEGYVNPTAEGLASAKPYQVFTANDLRLSGARYALIYAADFF